MKKSAFCLIFVLVVGRFCPSVLADVNVSAAISLKAALEKAQPELEKAAGEKIVFNFGASGTLALQIQQGAPVDLFLSADRATVQKYLQGNTGGVLEKGTDQAFAGNQLVLIFSRLSSDPPPRTFADLPRVRRLALGDPKAVPAGAYAKEALTFYKVWDTLEKSGKMVTAENVAQVLTFVSRGDADAGLVYATDARGSNSITVVAAAESASHSPIEYVGALVVGSAHHSAAAAIQKAVLTQKVQAIFNDFGFTAPPPASVPATTRP